MAQHDMDSTELRDAAAEARNEQVVRLTLDVSNLVGRPNNEWAAAIVFNGQPKACDICANRFANYVEDEDGNVHCLKDFNIYLINEDMKVVEVHS